MYTIKMDGQVIYSPALSEEYQVISANLQLEVDTAGSLTFMLPPGHMAHDAVQKLKSIITVECDGEEIFRGRAMEEKTDFYNQKEIYCEGDLNFLLDSVQRPYTHKGTARALLESMLAAHNAQVDADKHFTIGDVPIIDSMADLDLESDGYTDTLSAIRALLETTEGYLRTRYENGVRYLDCVTSFGENNGQAIEFGVNMLDLDKQTIAEEICTVLLPIGSILDDGTTVTIASVNDGSDTLENPEAIAQYGRIVKAYTFDQVTDPAELKKLAQEKLDAMAFTQSLTIKAVDMHLTQAEKDMIRLGIKVKLHSLPHGMDMNTMCIVIDLDLLEVDNTVYTFGKPARTQSGSAAMMASKINNNTRTLQNQLKHYKETDYTVSIHAGLLDSHEKYISQAGIAIDGINATIDLLARKDDVESRFTVQAGLIAAKADLILLKGYVKADELEARVLNVVDGASVSYMQFDEIGGGLVNVNTVSTGSLQVSGDYYTRKGLGLNVTYDSFTYSDQQGGLHGITYVKSVSLATGGSADGIAYLG